MVQPFWLLRNLDATTCRIVHSYESGRRIADFTVDGESCLSESGLARVVPRRVLFRSQARLAREARNPCCPTRGEQIPCPGGRRDRFSYGTQSQPDIEAQDWPGIRGRRGGVTRFEAIPGSITVPASESSHPMLPLVARLPPRHLCSGPRSPPAVHPVSGPGSVQCPFSGLPRTAVSPAGRCTRSR